jgi:hypothetical protein
MPKFAAEVLFLDPADVAHATEALAAVGCDYTIDRDAIGDYPTVFGIVTGTTELKQDAIGDWLLDILGPLGGDTVEWGYGPPWKIR